MADDLAEADVLIDQESSAAPAMLFRDRRGDRWALSNIVSAAFSCRDDMLCVNGKLSWENPSSGDDGGGFQR